MSYTLFRKKECEECGCDGDLYILHVHHKDSNHFNDDPSNLKTLCTYCHGIAHAKRPKGEMLPSNSPSYLYAKICLRCGHEWHSFLVKPKQCPRCKRYDWKNPGRVSPANRTKTCLKCGHVWQAIKEHPVVCTACKRPDYMEPRVRNTTPRKIGE